MMGSCAGLSSPKATPVLFVRDLLAGKQIIALIFIEWDEGAGRFTR
jgi:hypothetical protein